MTLESRLWPLSTPESWQKKADAFMPRAALLDGYKECEAEVWMSRLCNSCQDMAGEASVRCEICNQLVRLHGSYDWGIRYARHLMDGMWCPSTSHQYSDTRRPLSTLRLDDFLDDTTERDQSCGDHTDG